MLVSTEAVSVSRFLFLLEGVFTCFSLHAFKELPPLPGTEEMVYWLRTVAAQSWGRPEFKPQHPYDRIDILHACNPGSEEDRNGGLRRLAGIPWHRQKSQCCGMILLYSHS